MSVSARAGKFSVTYPPSCPLLWELTRCGWRDNRHGPVGAADPRRPAAPACQQAGSLRLALRRGDPTRLRGVVPAQDRERAAAAGQRTGQRAAKGAYRQSGRHGPVRVGRVRYIVLSWGEEALLGAPPTRTRQAQTTDGFVVQYGCPRYRRLGLHSSTKQQTKVLRVHSNGPSSAPLTSLVYRDES
jgi:hypothetical protein